MLAFEGESHVEWFEGNFADYEEDKKRRLGIDSVTPSPAEVQEVLQMRGCAGSRSRGGGWNESRPRRRGIWPAAQSSANHV